MKSSLIGTSTPASFAADQEERAKQDLRLATIWADEGDYFSAFLIDRHAVLCVPLDTFVAEKALDMATRDQNQIARPEDKNYASRLLAELRTVTTVRSMAAAGPQTAVIG